MSINTGMFPDTIITNAGKQMITESQNGATLKFTRVALGDGVLGDNEDELELTALKNEKLSVNISSFKDLGTGQFTLTFTIDNSQVEKGFWHREIGIMASVDGGTEKLYAYTNAGSAASFLYDKTTPVQARTVKIDFVVGSAENVEIVVDKSIVYATQNDLSEHDADEDAHAALLNKINNSFVKENNLYHAEATGYGIVSGCEPSISGLTVKVGAGVIHLADGTRKEIVQTNITLDAADPTNPRIDLVYIDSTGTVAKITGTAAASPSVPALPSSGISVAQVSVAAGATTGTVTDSRGMLARYYNTGIVSVKDFGAVGDGTHDDTQAIQAALDSGGCVYLPKGTYVISDTININIEKASLNGAGGDTVIKAADTFPSGKFMLLFFSTSLYYLDRYKFINKHGNFSLRGIDAKWVNDYRSYDYKVKGIKIGGNINTEYEGQVDCQLFENIVFDYLYTCIELGSHEYKNTFLNLIFNWARYSVTSAADITDSGEANAFIDCSFWQRIHVSKTGMFFYSCTIHFNAWAWADEPYGHHLCDGGYRFTNCHFEWANGDNEVYSRLIYTIGGRISISDCEFVFNSKAKYRDYFFYAANTGYITIENCNSFIQYLVSTDNTPVCNSCVYLKGLTYWYRQNDDGYHVDIQQFTAFET